MTAEEAKRVLGNRSLPDYTTTAYRNYFVSRVPGYQRFLVAK